MKIRIIPKKFFEEIFKEELIIPFEQFYFNISEIFCIPALISKTKFHYVSRAFCRMFVAKFASEDFLLFFKDFPEISSQFIIQIFELSFTKKIESEIVKHHRQVLDTHLVYSYDENDFDNNLKALESDTRKLYLDTFHKFGKNFEHNFEQIISRKLLKEHRETLKIKHHFVLALGKYNIEYKEDVLERNETYILLGLASATQRKFQKVLESPEMLQNFFKSILTKKFLIALVFETKEFLFYKRLPDIFYHAVFPYEHEDFKLFFKLFIAPQCYYSLIKQNQPNIINKCNELTYGAFKVINSQKNSMLKKAFKDLRNSPTFVVKIMRTFINVFNKESMKPRSKFSIQNLFKNLKERFILLIESMYLIVEKMELENIRIPTLVSKGGADEGVVTTEDLNPEVKAILIELQFYVEKYPSLLKSFLEIKGVFVFLHHQFKTFRSFLFTKPGSKYIRTLVDSLNTTDMLNVPNIRKIQFEHSYDQFSLKIYNKTIKQVFEKLYDGIPKIEFFYPVTGTNIVFSLVRQFIMFNIKELADNDSSITLINYVRNQFTLFLEKISQEFDFYYSVDFASIMPEETVSELVESIQNHKKSSTPKEEEIQTLSNKDYLMMRRVNAQDNYKYGFIKAVKLYYKMVGKFPSLQMEDVIYQYNIWSLVNQKALDKIEDMRDVRLKLFFQRMSKRIELFIVQVYKHEMQGNKHLTIYNYQMKKHEEKTSIVETKKEGNLAPEDKKNYQKIKKFVRMKKSDNYVLSKKNVYKFVHYLYSQTSANFPKLFDTCQSRPKKFEDLRKRCISENPTQHCYTLNSFIIKSSCPTGTEANGHSLDCLPSCPSGFPIDPTNPMFCNKPQVIVRNILQKKSNVLYVQQDRLSNFKFSRNIDDDVFEENNNSITYRKFLRDFRGRRGKESPAQKAESQSNVFAKQFELEACPSNFEEVSLFCFPVCPEGWEDHGLSCKKIVGGKIKYYVLLDD